MILANVQVLKIGDHGFDTHHRTSSGRNDKTYWVKLTRRGEYEFLIKKKPKCYSSNQDES